MFTHACHCLDCQRSTGSAFVIHAVIAQKDLTITGETRAGSFPTGSGAGSKLHFCTSCGTFVWAQYLYHQVPVIALRTGTLDNPHAVSPQAHIFVRSKQPWVSLPAEVPTFEQAYDRAQVWPPESVARYESLG